MQPSSMHYFPLALPFILVIPVILSLYLLVKNRIFGRSVLAVAVVSIVVHALAYPVRGVGISVPIFIPPLVAALTAVVLSWRKAAPLAARIGVLIGRARRRSIDESLEHHAEFSQTSFFRVEQNAASRDTKCQIVRQSSARWFSSTETRLQG